jgi:hypothetical protein
MADVGVLIDVDARRPAEVCQRFGIGRLLWFGSVARGDASPHSDVLLEEMIEAAGQATTKPWVVHSSGGSSSSPRARARVTASARVETPNLR